MTDPNHHRRVDVRLKRGLESGTLPKDLLICGPAGTGKTYGVLSVLHTLCRDYGGLRVLVARQTRASLTESVLADFEDFILPEDGSERLASGERRDHRAAYRYPNRSRIVLGGLDKPDRILSTAWDFAYINEAIEAQENAWETLRSRMNRPGRSRRFGFLLGDTNPGDPQHWLKGRVDKGLTAYWFTSHAANPALYGHDGWTPAWDAYKQTLDQLTGLRRKRLLEGLWAAGEGQWFDSFDVEKHVGEDAEYDRRYPVHLAVDTGVHTGAVWFQVIDGPAPRVHVFADYYSYGVPAYDNAARIMGVCGERSGGRYDVGRMDPSGNADNGTGTVIGGEFGRAGLRLHPWPKFPGCVASGLALVESFVAVDPPTLRVHPRCRHLIDAFANYRRKKRGGQFIDEPEDPQHPHEDLIDALRSGLLDKWPEGRVPQPKLRRVHAGRVF